jgi:hypothetical protein
MPGQHIADYLEEHTDLEIEGDPDVLGAEIIDDDGDSVVEVGARARRRGSFSPFSFRKLRIPSNIVRSKMSLAPARPRNPRRTYGETNEGGALTPLAVGRATAANPTVTIEPQNAFMPVRMILSCFDTAAAPPADLLFSVQVSEIKVGARTMFRAGGAAGGATATLWSSRYTGGNPSRFDTIRPGTQFQVTINGLAGTVVCDIALVGRAG